MAPLMNQLCRACGSRGALDRLGWPQALIPGGVGVGVRTPGHSMALSDTGTQGFAPNWPGSNILVEIQAKPRTQGLTGKPAPHLRSHSAMSENQSIKRPGTISPIAREQVRLQKNLSLPGHLTYAKGGSEPLSIKWNPPRVKYNEVYRKNL